jgi:hypothetical protein
MENKMCICENCNSKGWIETFTYGSALISDGTLIIEKCDECNIFISDTSAANFAYKKHKILSYMIENGLNIRVNYTSN